jgi:uncharacterized protein (TIGR02996 family)
MSLDAGFLKAILDSPDDDGPRLVYADWLDEQGEVDRAEFIRIQIGLARLAPWDPRRHEPKAREQALLARHDDAWAGALKGCPHKFRRGLLEHIGLHPHGLLDHPEPLLAHGPAVNSLSLLSGLHNYASRLARCPALACFRHQALRGFGSDSLRPGPGRDLLHSPHLTGLRSLELRSHTHLGPTAVGVLADAPFHASLERLDLSDNPWATAACLQELSESTLTPSLTDLRLDRLGAGARGAEALTAGWFGRLRSLSFRGNGLHNAGARRLAGMLALRTVEWLDLGDNGIGTAGARALASSRHLSGLKAFRLVGNQLDVHGARALAESPYLTGLEALDVSDNAIGDSGAEALLRSPNLAGLKALDLRQNCLNAGTVLRLREENPGRVILL